MTSAISRFRFNVSGVWEAPRTLVFDQRVSRSRFHVSRKIKQSPAPILEGRYNDLAVGALSAPLLSWLGSERYGKENTFFSVPLCLCGENLLRVSVLRSMTSATVASTRRK